MVRLAPIVLVAACTTSSPHARPPVAAPAMAAPAAYLLLEPIPDRRDGELKVFRPLAATDPRRQTIERALTRPYLRWVLAVGAHAKDRARRRCGADRACAARFDHPAYFVIVDGGNRPRHGLAIADGGTTRRHPDAWYVEIDPETAGELIPHEYGHVMMFESLPGDLPDDPYALPHTTGAITNDTVAFSEGWGIHFETLAGDRRDEPETFVRMHRDVFPVAGDVAKGDSLLPAADLMTYAQSYRRYTCVKENCFAYLPRVLESYIRDRAPTADDVLARYTDTTVDPARLRSLPQMVASEGVVAALFYRLATAPSPGVDPALPDPARYAAFFDAFAQVTEERARRTPAVLVFLEALLEAASPAERARIARIAMEVFHYTPGVADAPRIYAELHAAGHRIDKPSYQRALAAATPELERAIKRLVDDPATLRDAIAPELWLLNDRMKLDLPILGLRQTPLVIDLNTAPVEMLMTIPGVSYAEATAIDTARRPRGLRDIEDLTRVRGVRKQTVAAVRAMRSAFTSAP